MSALADSTVHVATDWPAFGLFFLGLAGTFGGFGTWVLRRLDKNRKDWKDFVAHEVSMAVSELKNEVVNLSTQVTDNSHEVRDQGKAIARIEGRLGTNPPAQTT